MALLCLTASAKLVVTQTSCNYQKGLMAIVADKARVGWQYIDQMGWPIDQEAFQIEVHELVTGQLVYDSGMRSGESLGSSAGRACLPARRLSSRSVCSFTVPACLPQSPARRNPPPPLPRSLERTLQPPCRIRTPLRPINRIRPGAACSSEVDVSVGAAVSGVSDGAAASAGFWLPSARCSRLQTVRGP